MLAQTFVHLRDGGFGGGDVAQRVQQHEVVDRAVVADGIDADPGRLQLAGVGLASSRSGSFSAVTTRAGGNPFSSSLLARSWET